MGSMEAEYETATRLSISIMTFDLGCPSSRSSKLQVKYLKMVKDTMLGSIAVEYELTHEQSIGTMTFDLG